MKEFMSKKATQIFGKEYEIELIERILGGAQKYTYLAKCTNGFKFVIYQWDKSTTYFKNSDEHVVFSSNSADLFQRNNELMSNQGVLTPKLFYIDMSRRECDYEYAFVEYINGNDIDYIMKNEPERLDKVLESLNNSIDRLHSIKNRCVGQKGHMQGADFNIIAYELNDIHQNSIYLQKNDSQYAELYVQAEANAIECAQKLQGRDEYTFIHGELGPNHVIVDKNNNAYLIDIEGAKFYDVEEELSFLDIRFNKMLEKSDGSIDEQRKYFYYIRHCFGNLRGAVELKQNGYYDMNDVNGMIEFFHKQIIELI